MLGTFASVVTILQNPPVRKQEKAFVTETLSPTLQQATELKSETELNFYTHTHTAGCHSHPTTSLSFGPA